MYLGSNDQENINPAVYEKADYKAFGKAADEACKPADKIIHTPQFIELSKMAIKAKQATPELRADIAYDMVCVGAALNKSEDAGIVKEIHDLFADLEVPDGHIVSREAAERGDFSGVEQKWQRIETLLLLAEYDSQKENSPA